MQCQCNVNAVPLRIIQFFGPCLYSTASSLDPFNRPLASIEASDRLKGSRDEPMQCQCNVNTVSLRIIVLIGHLPL